MFKKFVLPMLLVCLAFITPNVSFAFFFSSPESIVQKAPFPFDQSTTTRELLEGYTYFDKRSIQWSNYKTNQGRTVVEFTAKYIPTEKNINSIILLSKSSVPINDKFLPEEILNGWISGFKDDILVPIDIVFQATLNKDDTFSVAVWAERNGVPLKIEPSTLIQILIENKEIDNALFYVLYSDEELQKMSFKKFESMRSEKIEYILASLREKLPKSVGTRFLRGAYHSEYGRRYDDCIRVLSIVGATNNSIDIDLNAYCFDYNKAPACYKVDQKNFTITGEDHGSSYWRGAYIRFSSKENNLDFTWKHTDETLDKAKFEYGIVLGEDVKEENSTIFRPGVRVGDLLTDDPCQTLPNIIVDERVSMGKKQ